MALVQDIIELFTALVVVFYNYAVAIYRVFVPQPRKSIVGENVLVTGAGHGIGREFALEISKLGATVILWDINKENIEQVSNEIKANGGKAFSYVCDVRSFDAVLNVADKVRTDVGDVDILINNAGILNGGWLLDLKEEDIRRTFEVNTLAHFWTSKAFLPAMMKKQKGHILNVVSMAAFSGTALLVDYSASKSGAMGFCESLREELTVGGYKGIHVSALCPYFVTTGLVKEFGDKLNQSRGPKDTALTAIDGMLRNEQLIFSPRSMWWSLKLGMIMPRVTGQYLKLKSGSYVVEQYSKSK